MHPTAKFQFERAAREFGQWRAVPESQRSPAPAWWWQPAFEVIGEQGEMAALWCHRLELPIGSTYAAAAAVLMATLADQTFLPRPDEFPIKSERETSATHQPETHTDPGDLLMVHQSRRRKFLNQLPYKRDPGQRFLEAPGTC
jgi:hypothetical protein